jgi:hypothetical protein
LWQQVRSHSNQREQEQGTSKYDCHDPSLVHVSSWLLLCVLCIGRRCSSWCVAGSLFAYAGYWLYTHPLADAIRGGWARYNAMSPLERARELAEIRGEVEQRDWIQGNIDVMEKRQAAAAAAAVAARARNNVPDDGATEDQQSVSPEPVTATHASAVEQQQQQQQEQLPFVTLV